MSDSGLLLFGVLALLAEGIVFGILNEVRDGANVQSWFTSQRHLGTAWLAAVPSQTSRTEHKTFALGLVATTVLALVPWGFGIMDPHPCGAWLFYTLALICGAYSFWSVTPIARWTRLLVLTVSLVAFGAYGKRSVCEHTELDFPFVHPGVFIVQDTGQWLLMINGQNTHRSIFNVDVALQDMVTARAIPNEPDVSRRTAMIQGNTVYKHYSEIGPAFMGDQIRWLPIDVNNQEYSARATYRIGDKIFMDSEEIRITNVGEKFVSVGQTPNAKVQWQESITVKNQAGEILMHCVDPKFPRDARWIAGPVCYPGAKFAPLPRSLFVRCFGRGFEFNSDR